MRLGYMARDQYGETLHFPSVKNLRKALLDRLYAKSAQKVYIDTEGGKTKHIGYIVRGSWWTLYEIHEWAGKL